MAENSNLDSIPQVGAPPPKLLAMKSLPDLGYDPSIELSDELRVWGNVSLLVAEARNCTHALSHAFAEIFFGTIRLCTKECSGKRDDPIWGEDFRVNFPYSLRTPIIILIREGSKQSIFGSVVLEPETFYPAALHEGFYPLIHSSEISHASGSVTVGLKKETRASQTFLMVKFVNAKNIISKTYGGGDVVGRITYGPQTKKTPISKKSTNPEWDIVYEFLYSPNINFINIALSSEKKSFVGQTMIDLLDTEPDENDWITIEKFLHSKETSDKSSKQVGQLRLKLTYHEEVVLTMEDYSEFLEILTHEPDIKILHQLGQKLTLVREDFARTLVHIYDSQQKALEILKLIIGHEIHSQTTAETIFRANTLGSKIIDVYLKMVGMEYLKLTVGPIIEELYTTDKPYEVDPTKATPKDNIEENFKTLTYFVDQFINALVASIPKIPATIRVLFSYCQQKVREKDWNSERVAFTVISGFFFLRFICPAILNPKLFRIMNDHPDSVTARRLTLISKTIQSMANLAEFGAKESYMKPLNSYIRENTELMKNLIDGVSRPTASTVVEIPTNYHLNKELGHCHYLLKSNLDLISSIENFESTPLHIEINLIQKKIDKYKKEIDEIEKRTMTTFPSVNFTEETVNEPKSPKRGFGKSLSNGRKSVSLIHRPQRFSAREEHTKTSDLSFEAPSTPKHIVTFGAHVQPPQDKQQLKHQHSPPQSPPLSPSNSNLQLHPLSSSAVSFESLNKKETETSSLDELSQSFPTPVNSLPVVSPSGRSGSTIAGSTPRLNSSGMNRGNSTGSVIISSHVHQLAPPVRPSQRTHSRHYVTGTPERDLKFDKKNNDNNTEENTTSTTTTTTIDPSLSTTHPPSAGYVHAHLASTSGSTLQASGRKLRLEHISRLDGGDVKKFFSKSMPKIFSLEDAKKSPKGPKELEPKDKQEYTSSS